MKKKVLQVSLDPEHRQRLDAAKESTGAKYAELVRRAIVAVYPLPKAVKRKVKP